MTNWNDSRCKKCGKTPRDNGYSDAEAWTSWQCPDTSCGGELEYKPIEENHNG